MKPYMHPQTAKAIELFLSRPSHAVLLHGELHSGKGHLADYISGKLLSEQEAAGQLKKYDASGEVGIDQVREMQKYLSLTVPGKAAIRRVVTIENIEKLRHEAQNALLKILEEPPADTVLICTSSDLGLVLPTIRSRTTLLAVHNLQISQAEKAFSKQFSKPEIERAYSLSEGAVARMISLLESKGDHLIVDAIEWAKQALQMSVYERLLNVDDLSKNHTDKLDDYFTGLQKVLRASVLYGKSLTAAEKKRRVFQLEAVNNARVNLRANVQTKLVLTNLFMKL